MKTHRTLAIVSAALLSSVSSFSTQQFLGPRESHLAMSNGPAGSFFNQVPDKNDGEESDDDDDELEQMEADSKLPFSSNFDISVSSTFVRHSIGVGSSDGAASPFTSKPYVALGPPDQRINDVTKPEYDEQGYTVYTNEKTGEKSRVFEALVEYPCQFTMKIVGAKDGTFVQDIVQIVADSCQVEKEAVSFSTREMGKWTSLTVQAPVANADMLYQLYENVDKDPRVKFKF